ncbi:hypothetical protein AAU57_12950 [Nonlabens sp. YIK11]|uniref:glycosyltransferase n=1 Tax=Nonlabens sp. YIK11 TaxID=1453349 RepID=UPI0006DCB9D1|nr:galactosyltransferase-related protein [Nonlabens sp. YIK11]KQC34139.1 hypothetical protein AAU57_12950 [Nonlabens sp. YIK11]
MKDTKPSLHDITVVIPNRNRSIATVKRTLTYLNIQLAHNVVAVVVDYGSDLYYQKELSILVEKFPYIRLELCPVQQQLFHKTRAINLVLRQSRTPYFMVLDMDCICHPRFIKKAIALVEMSRVVNFPYGFLSKAESKYEKSFQDYKIDFVGGLTGTAIFNTSDLMNLNGFDEVYHNWGAEDADMFERLAKYGIKTTHYTDELLLLHQWHAKPYRQNNSTSPYHSSLEKINHEYFSLSRKLKRIKVNQKMDWGLSFDQELYNQLRTPSTSIELNSTYEELTALCFQLNESVFDGVLSITIKTSSKAKSLRSLIKSLLGKKQPKYLSLKVANELILQTIISGLRNQPYTYQRNDAYIRFVISLPKTKMVNTF